MTCLITKFGFNRILYFTGCHLSISVAQRARILSVKLLGSSIPQVALAGLDRNDLPAISCAFTKIGTAISRSQAIDIVDVHAEDRVSGNL